ncbi:MAG: GNAT family N-acetyltransferase [Cyclobacteriaceae bacterium]
MVEIVTYKSEYADAFMSLNYAWIEQLFGIEEPDKLILGDPEGQIINKGGEVLIALLNSKPVGACALVKKDEQTYELAKMAVSEETRGMKIGWQLGMGIVEKAKEFGAKKLVLETNSELKPAIGLYKKLGFQNICNSDASYQRCNVQMEMAL